MKRNLLAIAIPALLVAAGANASIEVWNKDGNKVDFYGRVKAANNITDRNQVKEGDDTSARLGMSGQTQITDSVTGYGRWEYEAKAGKDSHNEVRYAFAGLNFGDFGSFDYGRNDGVLKAITAYTDVLPQFGGDAANNNWNVLSARTKAVATYRNNNFFGLTDDVSFALQYADNGDNSNTYDRFKSDADNKVSREAYGANAQWRIFDTGLTAGAGYAQSTSSDHRHNTWTAGLKYDNYNLYLAANYFQSKIKKSRTVVWDNGVTKDYDNKVKGIELVAQYGIDLEIGRLTPSLAYVQHKVKSPSDRFSDAEYIYTADGYNSPLAKYVSVGATYDLNKNFSAIVEYKFNLLDRDDVGAYQNTKDVDLSKRHPSKPGTKDVLGVGLIYQF
ncbi:MULTISPECIES: porin [unclassified Gilliamella]|uniref:porin n=1 Tax=unclassified Gilliamella TaxID=2685620 RepID=UPI00226A8E0D|nr:MULTISPECIES: porin [unclassified Gilliamella]MCX8641463.1 porin [Gilliamella sp. B3835]MCX8707573.1 porin [Gilliamella sp. B3783]MCX8710653.1 porin [Gilliamella sp. B3780]MCX8714768.1 porin [Gilliamella sp. B3781]MCX8716420.1 porin [Gilliamella sp. B3784]